MRCGELRWNGRREHWEVFIPYRHSKTLFILFLSQTVSGRIGKPWQFVRRHCGLFGVHRVVLLEGFKDPGTFSLGPLKTFGCAIRQLTATNHSASLGKSNSAIWNLQSLYWKRAITGLLPHGPHNVRDVLATHILKQTGSYELASYAIQSTQKLLLKLWSLLAYDKTARAAKILNTVWQESKGMAS